MARVVSANSCASSEIEYVGSRPDVAEGLRVTAGMELNVGAAARRGCRSTIPYRFDSSSPNMSAPHPAVLDYPLAAPPAPGTTLVVAPSVHWLRMPLPFALDHINLWLLEEGPGWTVVDAGYAMPETRALWEQIFAERLGGLPVNRVVVTHYHPDHIGLAGWLTERW